jgi:hypothetical protein
MPTAAGSFHSLFIPSIETLNERIEELNQQRRSIWQNSTPQTGFGDTGRNALASIEKELEELYTMKRELIAKAAAPVRPDARPARRPGPGIPAGLFRDA